MRKLILATVALAGLTGVAAPGASATYYNENTTDWNHEHRVERRADYNWHHQRWHHRKWEHGHWRYYN